MQVEGRDKTVAAVRSRSYELRREAAANAKQRVRRAETLLPHRTLRKSDQRRRMLALESLRDLEKMIIIRKSGAVCSASPREVGHVGLKREQGWGKTVQPEVNLTLGASLPEVRVLDRRG